MRVVVDTNIWISLMIGHQDKFISDMLCTSSITVLACPELVSEICDVASLGKFSRWISERDILNTITVIDLYAEHTKLSNPVKSPIRDPKDVYLLTLAEQADADFIVSGDNDLLTLGKHKDTLIISLATFRNLVQPMIDAIHVP